MYTKDAHNKFNNQVLYIGIDVLLKSWTIIIHSNQIELSKLSQNRDFPCHHIFCAFHTNQIQSA